VNLGNGVVVDALPIPGTLSADQRICKGDDAIAFTVTGAQTLASYQWYDSIAGSGIVNTGGIANNSGAFTNVQDTTFVWFTVTNGACTNPVKSAVAMIAIYPQAEIVTDLTVNGKTIDSLCQTGTANLSITVNTSNTVSYRWYRSFDPANFGAAQTGGTTQNTRNWSAPAVTVDTVEYYKVEVFNGSATSGVGQCESNLVTSQVVSVRWYRQITNPSVTLDKTGIICEDDVTATYSHGTQELTGFSIAWKLQKASVDSIPNPFATETGNSVTAGLTSTGGNIRYDFVATVQNGVCPALTRSDYITVTAATTALPFTVEEDELCVGHTLEPLIDGVAAVSGQVFQIYRGTTFPPTEGITNTDHTALSTNLQVNEGTNVARLRAPQDPTRLDTTYYVRAQFGATGGTCPLAVSDWIAIKVYATPTLSTTTANTTDMCLTATGITVPITPTAKGTWTWHENILGGGWNATTQTDVSTTTPTVGSHTYTPTPKFEMAGNAAADNQYQFKVVVTNGVCASIESQVQTFVVWDTVRAGTIVPSMTPPITVSSGTTITFTVEDHHGDVAQITNSPLWSSSVAGNTFSVQDKDGTTVTANITADITLTVGNAGCGTNTSNFVHIAVVGGLNTPDFTFDENVVCVGSDLTLNITGIDANADSIRITSGAWLDTTIRVNDPISATQTVEIQNVPSAAKPAQTHSIAIRAFMTGVTSGPVTKTVIVRDSVKAGNLVFTGPPITTEREVSKGSSHGGLTLNNVVIDDFMIDGTPPIRSIAYTVPEGGSPSGILDPEPFSQSGTTWEHPNVIDGLSTWLANAFAIDGVGYDTVYIQAIADNRVCPPDSSNWVKVTLKEVAGIAVAATPSPTCEGKDITVTGTLNQALTIDYTATSPIWFREVFEVNDWSVPADRIDGPTQLTQGDGVLTFTDVADVGPGYYLYIVHYTTNGGLVERKDSLQVMVRVDSATLGGKVFNDEGTQADIILCAGDTPPVLTLDEHRGSVVRWEFSKTDANPWTPKTGTSINYTLPATAVADSGYYRAVVKSGTACDEEFSESILVRIIPVPNAGTITNPGILPYGTGVTLVHTGFPAGSIVTWDTASASAPTTWIPITTDPTAADIDDLYGTRHYRVTVTSAEFGSCEATTSIMVRSYDTLEIKPTSNFADTVISGNPRTAILTAVAGGHEAGNSEFVSINGTTNGAITYVWEMKCSGDADFRPITETGITGVNSATLNVQSTWYLASPECEYQVTALWTANDGSGHTSSVTHYVGKIRFEETLVAGTINDPGILCYNGSAMLSLNGAGTGQTTWFMSTTRNTGYSTVHVGTTLALNNFTGSRYYYATVFDGTSTATSDTLQVQSFDTLVFSPNLVAATLAPLTGGNVPLTATVANQETISGVVPVTIAEVDYQWQINEGSGWNNLTEGQYGITGVETTMISVPEAQYKTDCPDCEYRLTATWDEAPQNCDVTIISNAGMIVFPLEVDHIVGRGAEEHCIPFGYTVGIGTQNISGPEPWTAEWYWNGNGDNFTTPLAINNPTWVKGFSPRKDSIYVEGDMALNGRTLQLVVKHPNVLVRDSIVDYIVCVFRTPVPSVENPTGISIENDTICVNGTANFAIAGLADVVLSNFVITWEQNGSLIPSENGVTLAHANQTANATYQAIVKTVEDTDILDIHPDVTPNPMVWTSNTATLTVVDSFDITPMLVGDTVCFDLTHTFGPLTVTPNNAWLGNTFTWYNQAGVIAAAQNQLTYTTTPRTIDETFRFVANNRFCGDKEWSATVFVRGMIGENMNRKVDNVATALKAPIEFVGNNVVVAYEAAVTPSSQVVHNVYTYTWTVSKNNVVDNALTVVETTSAITSTFQFNITDMDQDSTEIKLVVTIDGCTEEIVDRDTIFLIAPAEFVLDSLFARVDGGSTYTLRGPNFNDATITVCNNTWVYFRPRITGGTAPFIMKWNSELDVRINGNPWYFDTIYAQDQAELEGMEFGFRIVGTTSKTVNLMITDSRDKKSGADVTINIIPLPEIVLTTEPRMNGDVYYEGQIINFKITPNRTGQMYQFRLEEGDGFGNYSPTTIGRGSNNNPVFSHQFEPGTATRNSATNTFEADFRMIGTANNGSCVSADTVNILLKRVPSLLIPDDPYSALNRVLFPNFDIEVFDSWGIRVQAFGTLGWNGKYNNREIRSGTYYYNVRIPTMDGFQTISGAITVINDSERLKR
jgi:hypothetical protein